MVMRSSTLVFAGLSLLFFFSLRPAVLRAADSGKRQSQLAVSIEASSKPGWAYDIVITNHGDEVARYWGYGGEGSKQPVHGIEVNDGERWRGQGGNWCGVGMGPCVVKPGETVKVDFSLPHRETGEIVVFRVSIRVEREERAGADYSRIVYSPAYEIDGEELRAAFSKPAQ